MGIPAVAARCAPTQLPPGRPRALITMATLVTGLTVFSILTSTVAHADVQDNMRSAVQNARAKSSCGPLTPSPQLDAAAQDDVTKGGNPDPHGYVGDIAPLTIIGDPTQQVTDVLIEKSAGNINNCDFKDFGVGMVRTSDNDNSIVSLYLGKPQSAKAATSGAPQDDLWTLFNNQHVSAGCPAYSTSQAVTDTAVDIARTLANPPGGIAGNGRIPTDAMLANRGYVVTSLGEADFVNNSGNATPQDAMNSWLSNGNKDIFPNCNNHDLGTAVIIQNGKWAAVALAASRQ
jgi:hypothetical protein